MKKTRLLRHALHGPWGDSALHLSGEELERRFVELSPPKDAGALALIVSRADDGSRRMPRRTRLSIEEGVPGDAWLRDAAEKTDAQITVMRSDVARLFANGQPLSLFGDNLLVDLDLSVANLPTGSRLGVGGALLEVTPEPHTGCAKFRQRVGHAALRMTAAPRYRELRLRGIYVRVTRAGEIAVGDEVRVLERGPAASPPAASQETRRRTQ